MYNRRRVCICWWVGTDSPHPEGGKERCLLGSPKEGGEAPSRVLPACFPAGLWTVSTLFFSLCSSYLQTHHCPLPKCHWYPLPPRDQKLPALPGLHILSENSPPITRLSHCHRATHTPNPGWRAQHWKQMGVPWASRLRTVAFRQLSDLERIFFKVAEAQCFHL